MGATFRFLAAPSEAATVLDWFRTQVPPPREHGAAYCCKYFFSSLGNLEDGKNSPVVNVFLPVLKRGVLTTIGEAHFLSTPMSQFPELQRISRSFKRWLGEHPIVFAGSRQQPSEFDYYLEGSIQNYDQEIYALPEGLRMLRFGSYFVSGEDSDAVLDTLCKKLRLRGVKCQT